MSKKENTQDEIREAEDKLASLRRELGAADKELREIRQKLQTSRELAGENALSASDEGKYKAVFENTSMAIIIADAGSLVIKEANARAADLLGRMKGELTGLKLSDIYPQKDASKYEGLLDRCIMEGHAESDEAEVVKKPAGRVPVYMSAAIIETGGEKLIQVMFRGMVRKKSAYEPAGQLELRYHRLFETAQNGFLIIDADSGTIIDANSFIIELSGYGMKEFVGKKLWELKIFKDFFLTESNYKEVLDKDVHQEELVLVTRGGQARDVEFVSSIYMVNDQKVVQCNIHDITERKKAEARSQFLSSVFEQSSDGMALAGLDGRLVFVNKTWALMHGLDPSENLEGKHLSIFHNKEQIKEVEDFNRKVMEKGFNTGEVGHVRKDGTPFIAMMSTTLLKSKRGEPIALAGIARDVTEVKKTAELLKKNEERYRLIVENQNDLIIKLDTRFKFTFVSETYCKAFNVSREELVGKRFSHRTHEDDKENTAQALRRLLTIPYKTYFEEKLQTVEGWRWFGWSGRSVVDNKGRIIEIIVVGRDVTEQKELTRRLEHINLVLWSIRNVNQLITREDDRKKLLQGSCDSLIKTGTYNAVWIATIDGSLRVTETAEAGWGREFAGMNRTMKEGELPKCMEHAIAKQGVIEIEDRSADCAGCMLPHRNGEEGVLATRLECEGRVYGYMCAIMPNYVALYPEERGIFKEIAGDLAFALYGLEIKEEKLRAEKELSDYHIHLEELVIERTLDLENANKAKSQFLTNMSHELRTPLNSIIGFSEVLFDQTFGPLNDKQKDYLNDVITSGRHLLSLINDILDIAKIESGKMELAVSEFSLRGLLENSLILIKEKAFNHGIKLSIEVGEGTEEVRADDRKIKQVVYNLLANAIKFTPNGGSIAVYASKQGDGVRVEVKDSGIGIREEDQEKIFNEFMQLPNALDKRNAGTGLGLALSKKMIELHGGRIWAESKGENKGSSFIFTLPGEPRKTDEEKKTDTDS
ncbi:MAG: PAS domain S-box protein [Elusimicrobia bacterium]|nr:PAS domain S-box protein [Elusimicrobiota bacterium]